MTDPGTLTPAQYVAGLSATVKRAILAAAESCAPAWRSVTAAAMGKSRQRVDDVCDLGDDAQLSVRDALVYPEPIRRAVAQLLIGEGSAIVPLPLAETAVEDMRIASRAHHTSAAAVTAALDACADSDVDAAEGAAIERACDAALVALLQLRALGQRAQRERVVRLKAVAR